MTTILWPKGPSTPSKSRGGPAPTPPATAPAHKAARTVRPDSVSLSTPSTPTSATPSSVSSLGSLLLSGTHDDDEDYDLVPHMGQLFVGPAPSPVATPASTTIALFDPPQDAAANNALAVKLEAKRLIEQGHARVRQSGVLSGAEVNKIMLAIEHASIRHQLGLLTQVDNYDFVRPDIVHPWYQVSTDLRKVIREYTWLDGIMADSFCDRTTDALTVRFRAIPEVMPGTLTIDPRNVKIEVSASRGVRESASYNAAVSLMTDIFRHHIGAPHVTVFAQRKEQYMGPNSDLRGLSVIDIINQVPLRAFFAGPKLVTRSGKEATLSRNRQEALKRSADRKAYVATDGLPTLSKFTDAVKKANLTAENMRLIKNVLLDTSTCSPPFEDWAFIFREEFGVDSLTAAKLIQAAIVDLFPLEWPL